MKKVLCVLFLICLSSISFAEEQFINAEVEYEFAIQELREANGRYYATPGSVYVAPNGIFINIKGVMLPVTGISVDAEGIYFEEYQCAREGGEWLCRKCGYLNYMNPGVKAKCKNCRICRDVTGS